MSPRGTSSVQHSCIITNHHVVQFADPVRIPVRLTLTLCGDCGVCTNACWSRYAKVRQAFQKDVRNSVTSMGWTSLFKTFDTDGRQDSL